MWRRGKDRSTLAVPYTAPSPDLVVSVAEYEQVREEILQRGNHQVTIQAAEVALGAAILSFSGHFKGAHASLLLAFVFPFALLAWYYFEQDLLITQAASYIERKLKPRISKHVSELMGDERLSLLGWETFRREKLLGKKEGDRTWTRLGLGFRYAAWVGPEIVLWVAGVRRFGLAFHKYPVLEKILTLTLIVAGLATILALALLVWAVFVRYRGIAERPEN